MATYLTVNYFIGELLIPNITGTAPAATASANNLKWFIAQYEPEFLELLLGTDLYEEFLAGLAANPVPAKWTALKNKIYQVDTQNGVYLSPAANYIYYHVMRDQITMTTSVGEVKPGKDAARPVSNTSKMVLAWNNMADKAEKIWEWLEENIDTYDTFDPYQENPFEKINIWNI